MHHLRLSIPLATLLATPLALAAATTTADQDGPHVGPYVGVSLGASSANPVDVATPRRSSDETDRAVKAYVGYQLTEHFGVQAGHVRLGRYQGNFDGSGATVQQSVSGRSLYVAATGRLPVGEALALAARLGVSSGKVTGTNRLPVADSLIGSKTSPLVGFGIEYRMDRGLAITIDYDAFGKLSSKLSASALTFGVRVGF